MLLYAGTDEQEASLLTVTWMLKHVTLEWETWDTMDIKTQTNDSCKYLTGAQLSLNVRFIFICLEITPDPSNGPTELLSWPTRRLVQHQPCPRQSSPRPQAQKSLAARPEQSPTKFRGAYVSNYMLVVELESYPAVVNSQVCPPTSGKRDTG
jgi:hypothetical protein